MVAEGVSVKNTHSSTRSGDQQGVVDVEISLGIPVQHTLSINTGGISKAWFVTLLAHATGAMICSKI